ncbi:PrsW family glutamic-type intramembrane protease [Streptomyces sp. CA-249302]|uniref:PrsW family glutamic-type intramembrane protease n=1 Tax=Streptomyces sp. CA-249302 TaxID=3240058 RepID=UPI003D8F2FF1
MGADRARHVRALGVLGTSVMEYYLLHPSLWMFVGVGLIEEAVKLGALMLVLRRQVRIRGMRAGLVLGATVGFGFAALESRDSTHGIAIWLVARPAGTDLDGQLFAQGYIPRPTERRPARRDPSWRNTP